MSNKIKLLDCTLRDGGFCLEDAKKNNISNLAFSKEDVSSMLNILPRTNIDIMEIGAIEISEEDKAEFCIYQSIEEISQMLPCDNNHLYAGMFREPDTPIEDIPVWKPGLIKGLRVILRYSELQKSLDFCKALAEKGYFVFVQPMLTMRYTDKEIKMIIDAANDMDAYALYFVDSYGYMQKTDVHKLFAQYHAGLKAKIKIGFHAHNNMNLVFANALDFLEITSEREIIVDACALGMGQGAGNLQTEIIADYMNKNYGKNYDYNAVLSTCEIIDKYYGSNLWGYSVIRLLPAIHKVAYKYAVALRHNYGLSFVEINTILENIPEELRHRYTAENTKKILNILNK